MRRFKILILLLCFLVYFFDTLAVQNMLAVQQTESKCCAENDATQTSPAECPKEAKDCATECINCPLCYVSTLPLPVTISVYFFSLPKQYAHYNADEVSDYHSDAWKPPNGFSTLS